MQIILQEDVDKLGHRGQLVEVAEGYARNYLLPRKYAIEATPGNMKRLDKMRVAFAKKEAVEKGDAQKLAELLAAVTLEFSRRTGDEEAATAEYLIAAKELASKGDFVAAGDLLQRVGHEDRAIEFYSAGWSSRPAANSVPCLLRLVDFNSRQESPRALMDLVSEADDFLEDPGREAEQIKRLRDLAAAAKLDPDFAEKFLNFIVQEVIRHHVAIKTSRG